MTGSMAETVHIYGEGFDAYLAGWGGWVAALMFVAAAAMMLPTVGFDAAHHPEAWWFRVGLMMFVPLGALASNGAWLLLGVLMAGATYPLVYAVLISRQPFLQQPLLLMAALAWVLGFGASFPERLQCNPSFSRLRVCLWFRCCARCGCGVMVEVRCNKGHQDLR